MDIELANSVMSNLGIANWYIAQDGHYILQTWDGEELHGMLPDAVEQYEIALKAVVLTQEMIDRAADRARRTGGRVSSSDLYNRIAAAGIYSAPELLGGEHRGEQHYSCNNINYVYIVIHMLPPTINVALVYLMGCRLLYTRTLFTHMSMVSLEMSESSMVV